MASGQPVTVNGTGHHAKTTLIVILPRFDPGAGQEDGQDRTQLSNLLKAPASRKTSGAEKQLDNIDVTP